MARQPPDLKHGSGVLVVLTPPFTPCFKSVPPRGDLHVRSFTYLEIGVFSSWPWGKLLAFGYASKALELRGRYTRIFPSMFIYLRVCPPLEGDRFAARRNRTRNDKESARAVSQIGGLTRYDSPKGVRNTKALMTRRAVSQIGGLTRYDSYAVADFPVRAKR